MLKRHIEKYYIYYPLIFMGLMIISWITLLLFFIIYKESLDFLLIITFIIAVLFFTSLSYSNYKKKKKDKEKKEYYKNLKNNLPKVGDEVIIKKDFDYSPRNYSYDKSADTYLNFKKGDVYEVKDVSTYQTLSFITLSYKNSYKFFSFQFEINQYWTTKSLKKLERRRKIKSLKE